jgi:hypothetical protein
MVIHCVIVKYWNRTVPRIPCSCCTRYNVSRIASEHCTLNLVFKCLGVILALKRLINDHRTKHDGSTYKMLTTTVFVLPRLQELVIDDLGTTIQTRVCLQVVPRYVVRVASVVKHLDYKVSLLQIADTRHK